MTQEYLVLKDFVSADVAKLACEAMSSNPRDDDREFYKTFSLFGPEILIDNGMVYDWDPEQTIAAAVKYAYSYFKDNYELEGELVLDRCYGNMMHQGASLAPHVDWDPTDINGYSAEYKPYIAGLFLNEDYEGGELYFPDINVSLHPEVGDLVLFTGHMTMHGVAEV